MDSSTSDPDLRDEIAARRLAHEQRSAAEEDARAVAEDETRQLIRKHFETCDRIRAEGGTHADYPVGLDLPEGGIESILIATMRLPTDYVEPTPEPWVNSVTELLERCAGQELPLSSLSDEVFKDDLEVDPETEGTPLSVRCLVVHRPARGFGEWKWEPADKNGSEVTPAEYRVSVSRQADLEFVLSALDARRLAWRRHFHVIPPAPAPATFTERFTLRCDAVVRVHSENDVQILESSVAVW